MNKRLFLLLFFIIIGSLVVCYNSEKHIQQSFAAEQKLTPAQAGKVLIGSKQRRGMAIYTVKTGLHAFNAIQTLWYSWDWKTLSVKPKKIYGRSKNDLRFVSKNTIFEGVFIGLAQSSHKNHPSADTKSKQWANEEKRREESLRHLITIKEYLNKKNEDATHEHEKYRYAFVLRYVSGDMVSFLDYPPSGASGLSGHRLTVNRSGTYGAVVPGTGDSKGFLVGVLNVSTKKLKWMKCKFPADNIKRSVNVTEVNISDDGKYVSIVGYDGQGGWVAVVDASTGKTLLCKKAIPMTIAFRAGGFTPDGKKIFAGGSGNNCYIWDIATSKEINVWYPGNRIEELVCSPDGNYLLAYTCDRKPIPVFDLVKNKPSKSLPKFTPKGRFAFSPNGDRIAISSAKGIKVYDFKYLLSNR